MRISDETANALRLILLDHRDCISREDFPMTCGKGIVEALRKEGIDTSSIDNPDTIAEIDSKANLIWQIDQLVELLEAGEDEEEKGEEGK